MKKQIIASMESVRSKLNVGKSFFEIFGYDFLIDTDF